jgi:hypothetical protein
MENEQKKEWSAPVVSVYGDVEELTQKVMSKQPGSSDDLSVNISNFP